MEDYSGIIFTADQKGKYFMNIIISGGRLEKSALVRQHQQTK